MKKTGFEVAARAALSMNDFVVGKDDFEKIEIHRAAQANNFYYFFDQEKNKLIKHFVLDERPQVSYVCDVALIKKGDRFTPRLDLSIRDKNRGVVEEPVPNGENAPARKVKAHVSLSDCHEKFWELISFLQNLREIDIPQNGFSLVSRDEQEIVSALRDRDSESIGNIIRQLSSTSGVKLSESDVNRLLQRTATLGEFQRALEDRSYEESYWQEFFETNKWVFGYGLDYQLLKQEQPQPYYGGARLDRKGGQKGDFLASTVGDINFTVLVEIKTPATPLLKGSNEIRSGAWSLSQELTDALSQILANVSTWEMEGSVQAHNRDRLESQGVYTVEPKGIIVIGMLGQLDARSKRETFQRFRRSIHGIDILTFDELHARASFIVNYNDREPA